MSSVQFHKAEQYLNNYLYDGYLSTFIYRDLGKVLNMSFDEFISRPKYEIEKFIKIADDVQKKRMSTSDSIIKKLNSDNFKNNIE